MMYLTQAQSKLLDRINIFKSNYPEVEKIINDDRFFVNDLPLSYRQINEIGRSGLIKDRRDNNNGWRRFNLIEAIFLSVIKELKGVGLTNKQLVGFKNSFYKNNDFVNICYLILAGENIVLAINKNGVVGYFDWLYSVIFLKLKKRGDAVVSVNLFNIASKFLKDGIKKVSDINVIYNFLEKVRHGLGDYPEEMGMNEEKVKKLIEKLCELSDFSFEKWIEDKSKK